MPLPSTAKRLTELAAAIITAAGLVACGSSSSQSASGLSSAKPIYGGTLRIVAASGPEHLDTVPSYYTADYQLTHAYTRQLLSDPTLPYTSTSDPNWVKDITPTADIPTQVPTVANGGITNGGKTCTFHIKQGVDWNTTPPRQCTARVVLPTPAVPLITAAVPASCAARSTSLASMPSSAARPVKRATPLGSCRGTGGMTS